ncbi:MAG: 2-succinyl-5-enolpyruvyl-6-hydroxy-3-cyclohexene-1-carboxylic-acid synthase [Flavobacteriales bacterium]
MISDKKAVQDIIQLLELKGVKHIIITPGSRNAPFSVSLANHPSFEVMSIVDERSAAYVGLGIAQQSDKPVALICTSGTAALNYAPAIAEAYYQEIPLIVITADRPMEWVNQGEGQTINQSAVFQNFVRASYDIIQDMNDSDFEWYNARVMNEAIDRAMSPVRGPIHLNFPLRENLYGQVESRKSEVKLIRTMEKEIALPLQALHELGTHLSSKKKIMILVGQFHTCERTIDLLKKWAQFPNVLVLTESHSGLEDESFIGCIDRMLMTLKDEEVDYFRPELVISIGKNIISKKVKSLLRNKEVEHWYVSEDAQLLDTFKRLTKIIPVTPERFFEDVITFVQSPSSSYHSDFMSLNKRKQDEGQTFVNTAPFSDLTATDIILRKLPEHSLVQMGNSSVARYIQLFDRRSDLKFSGNRGVSGIDGCTSTAIGAALVSNQLTTLISGDVSFFYDSNAFWQKNIPTNLKVIVINNGGGGIFRIIEGPSTTEALEEYFETTHHRKASEIAHLYGLECKTVSSSNELNAGLDWLFNNTKCAILEVMTPRLENEKILKGFFNHIKQNTSI